MLEKGVACAPLRPPLRPPCCVRRSHAEFPGPPLERALAQHVGFAAPAVPKDRLGASAAAFSGGRIEARFRGEAPVASVDFSKTYPMIAALLGINSFLSAEAIRFEEATEEARDLAQRLGLDDLLLPANWPQFAVMCW